MKVINTLEEYVKEIIGINNSLYDDVLNNKLTHCYSLLFRGQSDKDFELIPAIARGGTVTKGYIHTNYKLLDEERNLIEMAKYKKPEIFNRNMNPIELLSMLQHYGIPTRLLDLTKNSLVALYFACSGCPDKDGEVFVFKHDERDVTQYPIVNGIADSYRFSNTTINYLSLFHDDIVEQPYFLEQRRSIKCLDDTDEKKEYWIKECCSAPVITYAPNNLVRQTMQSGMYLLFPNTIKDNYFLNEIQPLPKNHEMILDRLIINKEVKSKILSQLELFGVDEERLFFDDTDKVCKNILNTFKR